MQSLGCVGGHTVHEALNSVPRATGTLPFKRPHLQDYVVHFGTTFEVIPEIQHLLILLVDLACRAVALAW